MGGRTLRRDHAHTPGRGDDLVAGRDGRSDGGGGTVGGRGGSPVGRPAGLGRLPSAKVPLPPGTVTVTATAETIDRKPAGTNDADDPSFWVHPTDPRRA